MKVICRGLFQVLCATLVTVAMAQANNPNQTDSQNQATPQSQNDSQNQGATQNQANPQNSPAYPQSNAGSATAQEQNDSQSPTVLVDPGKIYNMDPTSWVGKRVTLQNVMVEEADKTGNFWIGSDKNHRLLIVKSKENPNLVAKSFHKGDVVTIDGTIHPAGDIEAQETSASNGKMKKARQTSGVFLLANDVDIASSTQHK